MLVHQAVANGVEGQEADTSFERGTQDQRRASGVYGANTVTAGNIGDGSEGIA